ncbi:uncharacterized protein LOC131207761 [Anopheles bellator]|uniref:uncharacterized protein LOC131207761 n=1 Tax=Anopheles bellator TaxID=139047 RepID=UPI002647749D|nr:uncharacterized protein LOC131207761 [Anopheles bellator]
MKLALVLAITLATVATLAPVSSMHIAKLVVRKLVSSAHQPKSSVTAVVYTPVVAPPPVVYSPPPFVVPQPHHAAPASSFHTKLRSAVGKFGLTNFNFAKLGLGQVLKHPWLKNTVLAGSPLFGGSSVTGGVSEVYHETDEHVTPVSAAVVPEVHPAVVEQHEVVEVVNPPPTEVVEVVPETPVNQYPLPAPTPALEYGPPAGSAFGSSSASSASSSTSHQNTGEPQYVAVNLGARHVAPLPAGYEDSVLIENLQPAPGVSNTDTYLVPPVESNQLENNWNPVVLSDIPQELLRSGGMEELVDNGVKYIAINDGVRHEAPLPGYDRSIVIENLANA